MAIVTRKQPISIALSEFGLPDKDMPSLESRRRPGVTPPSTEELDRIDLSSYLFDAFIDGFGRVVLIGPPHFGHWNIAQPQAGQIEVPDLGFRQPLQFQWQKNNRRLVYYLADTDLPAGARTHDVFLDLTVNEKTVRRKIEPFFTSADRVITTLQKDHVIRHVLDWITYYGQLGVGEFLIYDNGSANVDELAGAIAEMPGDHRVHIIDWPYPYGVPRIGRLRFCQNCELNHGLAASKGAHWLLNFDIDEFLDLSNFGDTLDGLFARYPEHSGFVFDGNRVPVPMEFDIDNPYGPGDFIQVFLKSQEMAWKYLTKPSVTRFVNVHTIHLTEPATQMRFEPSEARFLHFMGLTSGTPGKIRSRLHDRAPIDPNAVSHTETVARVLGKPV